MNWQHILLKAAFLYDLAICSHQASGDISYVRFADSYVFT